jgi:hypothetical protein
MRTAIKTGSERRVNLEHGLGAMIASRARLSDGGQSG